MTRKRSEDARRLGCAVALAWIGAEQRWTLSPSPVTLEPANEVVKRDAQGPADVTNIEEVELTLSRFVLADEGLRSPKAASHIFLPESGLHPETPQKSS